MYIFCYEITNKINGKIYVGVHKTKNIDDGYMGSGGAHYRNALKKYGVDNFDRKILKYFDDEKSAYEYEESVVNEEFVSREDTYNENIGGKGGWYHINSDPNRTNPMKDPAIAKKCGENHTFTDKAAAAAVENLKLATEKSKGSVWMYCPDTMVEVKVYPGDNPPEGFLRGRPSISKKMKGKPSHNKGKKASESSKKKQRESWTKERKEAHANRQRERMKGNSIMKGTKFYHDPDSGKRKRFIPGTEPEGWVLGYGKK